MSKRPPDAMRVLLITDANAFASTERHIFDLAHGLRAEGIESWIASPSPSALEKKAEGIDLKHLTIQKGGLFDKEAVKILTMLLRSERIDIIHAHNGRTMLSAAMAVHRARKGRAIATQHALTPDHAAYKGPKALIYAAAHRWGNGKMTQLVAVSEAVRAAMLARHEAPKRKITVAPYGIMPIDRTGLATPEEVRAELNLPKGASLVVCVARLELEKDVSSLIAAMEEVKAQMPKAVCLIVGTGSQEEDLSLQIAELGLEGTVRLLGFREDVHSLIGSADLFVLPSLVEPFGLVLLEAMALGKPVIATRTGGPVEIVVDSNTGLLTPPGDPEALAEAICSLLADRPTLQMMGNRGYTRFQDEYTAKLMSREMLRIYERALQAKPGG